MNLLSDALGFSVALKVSDKPKSVISVNGQLQDVTMISD
jgi:hypothetical protein